MGWKNIERKREYEREYFERNKEKLRNYRINWRFKKLGRLKTRERKNILIPEMVKPSFALGYVLGTLWGDGYICKSHCGIEVTDKDFADFFKEQIKKIYPYYIEERIIVRKIPTISKKALYLIKINSQEYVRFLNNISKEEILLMPYEFKSGFLRGMFDSEGSVTLFNLDDKRKIIRVISFSQSINEGLEIVLKLLDEFELSYSLQYSSNSGFIKNKKYCNVRIFVLNNLERFK